MIETMPLSQFVEINPKIKLIKGTEYPFVEMNIVTPGCRYISSVHKRNYNGGGAKFRAGDTLFARITPCLENGKIAQFFGKNGEIGFGSTEFFVFRYKEGISDPGYVFYLANSDIVRKPAEKSMFGASGRQRADLASIKDLEIPAPPLPIQRKIAAILSAYDDLIENNTRRIKILEEMAQALYREWFMKFRFPGHEKVKMVESELGMVPEGWEVKNVFDLADVAYGIPLKSKNFSIEKEGTPVIRIRDIPNGETKTFTTEEADEKYVVENGDILVGMDGDFHMNIWSGGRAYQNQRVARFKSKGLLGNYYLFLSLIEPILFFDSTIVGTTVAHLGDKHIKTIKILLPSEKILELAIEEIEPLAIMQLNLKLKNRNLRRTRDLLLPKLISGEVDVENIDVQMPNNGGA